MYNFVKDMLSLAACMLMLWAVFVLSLGLGA
jgi:hypothetical protein